MMCCFAALLCLIVMDGDMRGGSVTWRRGGLCAAGLLRGCQSTSRILKDFHNNVLGLSTLAIEIMFFFVMT